jgi:hypothetical protein
MEEQKATKVGCQACKNSPKIKTLQNFVFIAGGIVVFLLIFGLISVTKFIMGLF